MAGSGFGDPRGNAFALDQLPQQEGHDHHTGHEHGAEGSLQDARPNRGTTATSAEIARRKPGTALEGAEKEALLGRLRAVPRAAQALAEIKALTGEADIPIRWSGRGTYMTEGEVWVDLRAGDTEALVTMSHELIHLLAWHKGFRPEARKMERGAFVDTMMSDELDSEEASLVAGLQLTKGKGEPRSGKFREWLNAQHPGVLDRAVRSGDPAQWQAIEHLARGWSEDQFRNVYKTSNTGQNYYQYWGSFWDKSQRSRPAREAPAPASAPHDMKREGTITDPHDRSKAVPVERALEEARAQGGGFGTYLMNRYGFGPQLPEGGRGDTLRFFSNGLNTPEPEASRRTRYIADLLGQPMMHLHNGTMKDERNPLDLAGKGAGDLVRANADSVDAIAVRQGLRRTEYMKQLEKLLTAAFRGADPQDVHAILHSDATIGGPRVIAEFKHKEIERRLAKVPLFRRLGAREQVTREVEALLERHLFVELHGNASAELPRGPRYLVWTDELDPVTHNELPVLGTLGVAGSHPASPDPNVVYVDYAGPFPDWDSHNLTAGGAHVVKATLELNGVQTTEELHGLAASGATIKVPKGVRGDVKELWNERNAKRRRI